MAGGEEDSDDELCAITAVTRVDDPVASFDLCGEEDEATKAHTHAHAGSSVTVCHNCTCECYLFNRFLVMHVQVVCGLLEIATMSRNVYVYTHILAYTRGCSCTLRCLAREFCFLICMACLIHMRAITYHMCATPHSLYV